MNTASNLWPPSSHPVITSSPVHSSPSPYASQGFFLIHAKKMWQFILCTLIKQSLIFKFILLLFIFGEIKANTDNHYTLTRLYHCYVMATCIHWVSNLANLLIPGWQWLSLWWTWVGCASVTIPGRSMLDHAAGFDMVADRSKRPERRRVEKPCQAGGKTGTKEEKRKGFHAHGGVLFERQDRTWPL